MKKSPTLVSLLPAIFLVIGLAVGCSSSTAQAQSSKSNSTTGSLPPAIIINTGAQSGSSYADAVGVASIISKYTPMHATVVPDSSTGSYIRKLRDGETDMVLDSALNFWPAFHGTYNYAKIGPTDMRLVKIGGSGPGGFAVSILADKKLGIKSVSQLKGMGLSLPVPRGSTSSVLLIHAILMGAGLNSKDVKMINVAGLRDGVRMMKQGITKLGWCRMGASLLKDLESTVPVRFLDATPISKETKEKMLQYLPLITLVPEKGGSDEAIPQDINLVGEPVYLVCRPQMSDAAVYAIAKALYEHYNELAPINHELKESFTPKKSVSSSFDIPFDPGAVKFYKEAGIWTPQIAAMQQKALARNKQR